MSKIAEQRATLHLVDESVKRIENRIESAESSTQTLSSKADNTHLSVMSLRSLGEQIMATVHTFPHDIRNLLHTVIQGDWRTYQAVLQIQERLARSPTSLHDSNIQFTNVLGEYRELPYEYFCQWEVRLHAPCHQSSLRVPTYLVSRSRVSFALNSKINPVKLRSLRISIALSTQRIRKRLY